MSLLIRLIRAQSQAQPVQKPQPLIPEIKDIRPRQSPKPQRKLDHPIPVTPLREIVGICTSKHSASSERFWKEDPCLKQPLTSACRADSWTIAKFFPTFIFTHRLEPMISVLPYRMEVVETDNAKRKAGSSLWEWEQFPNNDLVRILKRPGVAVILARMGIEWLNGSRHANAVVIDIPGHRILRFEPQGKEFRIKERTSPGQPIDDLIRRDLLPLIERTVGTPFTYSTPAMVCPRIRGPQTIEVTQERGDYKQRCRKGGWCAGWSALFLFLVLLNPGARDEDIINEVLHQEPGVNLHYKMRRFFSFMQQTVKQAPRSVKTRVKKLLDEADEDA